MSYQALYRKYRPQLLKDVVGQQHITRTIHNAFFEDKLSHAYLFVGPRGTGKTSVAKLIAKTINCESLTDEGESCGKCETCKGIARDQIADVVELDAASNNGVDEVRDIREKVKFAPSSKYKVYIIDEVHMLTTGAFNALLKTLEEPPKNVIFILATTEAHKVPVTIISRCQRFDFKRMTDKNLVDRMRYVCSQEQFQAQDNALQMIARVAQGGMRDALSLLDQAISYAGGELKIEHINEITGSVSQKHLQTTIEALVDSDKGLLIDQVTSLIDNGQSPDRFCHDLMTYLRDLLMIKSGIKSLERISDASSFRSISNSISHDDLYQLISFCEEGLRDMRYALSPKIVLETTLIKAANYLETDSQDSAYSLLQEKINQLEATLHSRNDQPINPKVSKPISPPAMREVDEQVDKAWNVMKEASKQNLTIFNSKCWSRILECLVDESIYSILDKESNVVLCSQTHFVLVTSRSVEVMNEIDIIEEVTEDITTRSLRLVVISPNQWKSLKEKFMQNRNATTV
ncbi:DNA polymerase III subunit gamma/tau (plasmid) [Alkalihalophilus sp. As8PL]|uniref:DNA-directed DNA polymerase n=1 Tax=Alkalihalophilus sp. As8PL TaxID=3237103 RepID=A0AB39BMW4_9BACI